MYVPAPGRYDAMPYRRCGRSGLRLPAISLGLWQNFGDDRPLETQPGDPAPGLRPRHHPLRPGQQLRAALRRRPRRTSAACSRDGLPRPTATSWSSRPRPATTCGPGPTASGARASTCWPASTRACSAWASTTSTSSTRTASTPRRRWRRRWARSTPPCARARRCTSASPPTPPQRTREAARILRQLGTPLLIHQPSYSMLNRWIEGGLLDVLDERGRRLHRLLAAGPGAAHRPLPRRRPRGFTRAPRRVASTERC